MASDPLDNNEEDVLGTEDPQASTPQSYTDWVLSNTDAFAAPPKPKGILGKTEDFIHDRMNDTAIGIQQLPGIVTGVGDIAAGYLGIDRPFDKAATALGERTGFTPAKWAEQRTQGGYYSPEFQKQINDNEALWAAKDKGEATWADIGTHALQNPEVALSLTTRSVPAMVTGTKLGQVVTKGSKMLAPMAPHIGEGLVMGGSAMDSIDDSVDPRAAALAATGIAAGGAAIGKLGGAVSSRAGALDPDKLLANGYAATRKEAAELAKGGELGLIPRVGLGGAIETGEEVLQSGLETLGQNAAEQKPLTEGMGRSMFEGGLAGGVMGVGMNIPGPIKGNGPLSNAVNKSAPQQALNAPLQPNFKGFDSAFAKGNIFTQPVVPEDESGIVPSDVYSVRQNEDGTFAANIINKDGKITQNYQTREEAVSALKGAFADNEVARFEAQKQAADPINQLNQAWDQSNQVAQQKQDAMWSAIDGYQSMKDNEVPSQVEGKGLQDFINSNVVGQDTGITQEDLYFPPEMGLPHLPADEVLTFPDGSQARKSEILPILAEQGLSEQEQNLYWENLAEAADSREETSPDPMGIDSYRSLTPKGLGLSMATPPSAQPQDMTRAGEYESAPIINAKEKAGFKTKPSKQKEIDQAYQQRDAQDSVKKRQEIDAAFDKKASEAEIDEVLYQIDLANTQDGKVNLTRSEKRRIRQNNPDTTVHSTGEAPNNQLQRALESVIATQGLKTKPGASDEQAKAQSEETAAEAPSVPMGDGQPDTASVESNEVTNRRTAPEINKARFEKRLRAGDDGDVFSEGSLPEVQLKNDGNPFKTEKSANNALNSTKVYTHTSPETHEVVPVEGGYGLQAKAPASTTTASEDTADNEMSDEEALARVLGDTVEPKTTAKKESAAKAPNMEDFRREDGSYDLEAYDAAESAWYEANGGAATTSALSKEASAQVQTLKTKIERLDRDIARKAADTRVPPHIRQEVTQKLTAQREAAQKELDQLLAKQAPANESPTTQLDKAAIEKRTGEPLKQTIARAKNDFSFLLTPKEKRDGNVTDAELADRIAQAHDLANPKTQVAYSALKLSSQESKAQDPEVEIKSRPRKKQTVNPEKDSLLTALRKLGGVSKQQLSESGIDTFKMDAFLANNKTENRLDGIGQVLLDMGYPLDPGQLENSLIDLISQELSGKKVHTPEGAVTFQEAQDAQRQFDDEQRSLFSQLSEEEPSLDDFEEWIDNYFEDEIDPQSFFDEYEDSIPFGESSMTEKEAMDAMGFSQEEQQEMKNDQSQSQRGNQPDSEDLLSSYTEKDIQEREQRQKDAELADKKAKAAAEKKKASDASVNTLVDEMLGGNVSNDIHGMELNQVKPKTESSEKGNEVSAEVKKAQEDLDNALDDLGQFFLDNSLFTKKAAPGEFDDAALMPILARVMDAAIRLGYAKFKQAAQFALNTIREKFGDNAANALTIDHLQGSYIAVAGKHKEKGTDSKKEVINVESIDEIEAYQHKEEANAPNSNSNLESDRGDAGTEDGGNEKTVRNGRSNDGQNTGQGSESTEGQQRGSDSNRGLSDDPAALDRERGDQPVHSTDPSVVSSELPTGVTDGERGGNDGNTGILSGSTPDPKVKSLIEQRSKKAPTTNVVKKGDRANVEATVPVLTQGQMDDVLFAEKRFEAHSGVLFTNSTGTGKTFSGLGIIKRMVLEGKNNILIVSPSDGVNDQWVAAASKFFDLKINPLKSTKDRGQGVNITTFANFGSNNELSYRQFDAIIFDESHKLMHGKNAKPTDALQAMRAATGHERGFNKFFEMQYPEEIAELKASRFTYSDDMMDQMLAELRAREEKAIAAYNRAMDKAKADYAQRKDTFDTKIVFLSASPFAYALNIDYAEGYLFNYGTGDGQRGYNSQNPHDQFYIENFGYRMRTGKLTQPEASVNSGLMEREFNAKLRREGALSHRELDVEFDYDRKFVQVDSTFGRRIDEAMEWIREQGFLDLHFELQDSFGSLQRRFLLEGIKAQAAIDLVKKNVAMGRKVVVFHDYKVGGATNPFKLSAPEGTALAYQIEEFNNKFGDLVRDFSSVPSPIDAFTKAFGEDVLLYNGDVSKLDRAKNINLFNQDGSGKNILLAQSASAKEGVSMHDTTGKHPRVLLNLGLPTAPTTAIQQEGRIFRVGQASNAMIRYMNTGTNWERWAFATTMANRAATAENLGAGEGARGLRDSFVSAFENSDTYPPGHEGEGQGGKAFDRQAGSALTEYDRAKTFYFSQQQKTSRTKSAEGTDYYATPEPIGVKIVQFADIRRGDHAMEPSAGHGAIARWLPENVTRTAIEPSGELSSKLAIVFDGNIKRENFEDLHINNKFDNIVMNPPYGKSGATAISHLKKAYTHLKEGGRIVAVVPQGPAFDSKFNAWMESDEAKEAHIVAEIKLPQVTFKRAGTQVLTKIVVIDKADAMPTSRTDIDLSDITDINDLFDRMENMEIPERSKAKQKAYEGEGAKFKKVDYEHTKTKEIIPSVKTNGVSNEAFGEVKKIAKKHDGYYNTFAHMFFFKTEEAREDFLEEISELEEEVRFSQYSKVPNGKIPKGIPVEEAQKIVDEFMAEYNGLIPLDAVVVKHQSNIYGRRNKIKKRGVIKGAYHPASGKLVLVAANLDNAEDGRATLRHEVLAHFGLNTFTRNDKRAILDQIIRSAEEPSLKPIWAEVNERYDDKNEDVRAEEVLARLAEEERNVAQQVLDKIVALIKKALRRIGLLKGEVSRAELRVLLQSISDGIKNGTRLQQNFPQADDVLFSKTPKYSKASSSANDLDQAYFEALERGDEAEAQRLVNEAAERAGVPVFGDDSQNIGYKIRRAAPPKKTVKVYKAFRLRDGKLYPMFVGAKDDIPIGQWMDATEGGYHFTADNGREYIPADTGESITIPSDEIRQELLRRGYISSLTYRGKPLKGIKAVAYRPGWHGGELPFFPQAGNKVFHKGKKLINEVHENYAYPNVHEYDTVIAEVEMDADYDYKQEFLDTAERNKDGSINKNKSGLRNIPKGGFYEYATNPLFKDRPELGKWYISGSVKINKILTQDEVNKRLDSLNVPRQLWNKGKNNEFDQLNLDALGYDPQFNHASYKLLDVKTYDDNGNIIPLSERFNLESSDPRFSQNTGAVSGSSVADVTSWLSTKAKKMLGENLVVVQSVSDLPQQLQKGLTEGLYDPTSGKTYLVADMLTKGNIHSVIAHEMLHKALAENPKLREQVESAQAGLRDIYDQIQSGRYNGPYKTLYEKAMQRVNNANPTEADRFEEFLAYTVTAYNENQSLPAKIKRFIEQLISAVKRLAVAIGVPVAKLTPADLHSLAMRAVTPTQGTAQEGALAMASQADGKAGWTQDRISNLLRKYAYSMDDNKTKAYAAWVSPEDFLAATTPKAERSKLESEKEPLREANLKADEEIRLYVNKSSRGGYEINGHEGRHRMMALRDVGVKKVAIAIVPDGKVNNAQVETNIKLQAQDFWEGVSGERGFFVQKMTPISYAYQNKLDSDFGNTASQVKFSTASPSEMAWGTFKKGAPDMIESFWRKTNKARRKASLSFLSFRQLTEVANELFKGLTRDVQQSKDEMEAMEQRIIHQASLIYEKGKKLSKEERKVLGELAHLATFHQVSADPATPFEYTGHRINDMAREEIMADLQDRFKNELSSEGQVVYREMRDFYKEREKERREGINNKILEDYQRGIVSKGTLDTLDKLWAKENQLKGDYFPLSRFGDYWISYENKDGISVMETFDTQEEGRDRITALGLKEGTYGFGMNGDKMPQLDGVSPGFIDQINTILGRELPEEMASELQDAVYQTFLATLPNLSGRKTRIHRKNVLGYSDDVMRAFAYRSTRDAKQNSRITHAHKVRRLIDDGDSSVKMAESPKRMKDAKIKEEAYGDYINDQASVEELERRMDYVEGDTLLKYKEMIKIAKEFERNASAGIDEQGNIQALLDRYKMLKRKIEIAEHIKTKDDSGRTFAANMIQELKDAYVAMMEPSGSVYTEIINNIGFVQFLGASPGAAFINALQTPAVAVPYVAGRYGLGKTTKAFSAAYDDFIKGAKNAYGEISLQPNLKNKREEEAFQTFFDRGLFSRTMAHDMIGAGNKGVEESVGLRQAFNYAAGGMFQFAERVNREITAMATYRLAYDDLVVKKEAELRKKAPKAGDEYIKAQAKKEAHVEAISRAIDDTWATHGDYSSSNRARVFRGNIARIATQFKQYSQFITFLYFRTAFKALPHLSDIPENWPDFVKRIFPKNTKLTKEEVKIARDQLRNMLVAQTMFAGTAGLPLGIAGYTLLAAIVEGFAGDDDEPFDLDAYLRKQSTDLIGDTATRMLAHGLLSVYGGPDIHSRLSQADLWIRESDLEAEGKDQHSKLLNFAAGPVFGGMLGNIATAYELAKSPYDGSTWRGVEKVLPKAVGDVMKALRYSMEDATTLKGEVIQETNLFEEIVKALGLSPAELNDRYQQNNVLMNLQGDLQERRTYLIQKAAIARRKRDNRALKDIWNNEIKPFNQHWRGQGKIPIKMSEVIRSANGMASSSKRTENGIILNKRYQPFLEQYDYLS